MDLQFQFRNVISLLQHTDDTRKKHSFYEADAFCCSTSLEHLTVYVSFLWHNSLIWA